MMEVERVSYLGRGWDMNWHEFAVGCLETFLTAVLVLVLLLVALEKCS